MSESLVWFFLYFVVVYTCIGMSMTLHYCFIGNDQEPTGESTTHVCTLVLYNTVLYMRKILWNLRKL